MIWMRIGRAFRTERHHNVWPLAPEMPHDLGDEYLLVQRAQPAVPMASALDELEPQRRRRLAQLGAPNLGERLLGHRPEARCLAGVAVGGAVERAAHTGARVPGERPAAREGLVVGMRVHRANGPQLFPIAAQQTKDG